MNKKKGIYEKFIKRFLDIFLSFNALLFLSPILLVTALLIRIKLGGPILFKQERVGQNNKVFRIYKFRTMTDERDENGELLPDTMRLTKFGKLLRSTSIDELPELINILKGDMSIIGPRPLPPIYLPYYTSEERHRHDIRPGLSGLAQASGRNSLSWEKKFAYDLEYLNNITFCNDAKIVFNTIKKVLVREGIGQGEKAPESLHIERKDWILTQDGAVENSEKTNAENI